jgi:hypothetical protein
MLRFICTALVVVTLLGVSSRVGISTASTPVLNRPQVADDTGPIAPPFPLGPQVADDTGPIAPPFPLAA